MAKKEEDKKHKKGGMAAYERSAYDKKADKEGAKKRGMSVKAYEKTAEDEKKDRVVAKKLGYLKEGGRVKKMAKGGVTSADMKKMGRNMARIANQKSK